MSLKRCGNGHLYNPKKYAQCPYCEDGEVEKSKDKKEVVDKKYSTVSDTNDSGLKTKAFWNENEGVEPVVGWLVCIEGTERGKDYKLRSDKNFIGRSEEMHICIASDTYISRRNHAVVAYNPKQRNFVLIPGEGTGIIYVNEEAIYAPTEIKPYDVVEMGKSKFIFISLCGQHFEWEL
jgi:hypothetical protein